MTPEYWLVAGVILLVVVQTYMSQKQMKTIVTGVTEAMNKQHEHFTDLDEKRWKQHLVEVDKHRLFQAELHQKLIEVKAPKTRQPPKPAPKPQDASNGRSRPRTKELFATELGP